MPTPKKRTSGFHNYWKAQPEHWRVDIAIAHCGMLQLASWTEPVIERNDDGTIAGLDAEWIIEGPCRGADLVYIDCAHIAAITVKHTRDNGPDEDGDEGAAKSQ